MDPIEILVASIAHACLSGQSTVVALKSYGLGSVALGAIRDQLEGVAEVHGPAPLVLPVFNLRLVCVDPARIADKKIPCGGSAVGCEKTPRACQRSQAMPDAVWRRTMLNRVSKLAALSGREALLEFGFKLR